MLGSISILSYYVLGLTICHSFHVYKLLIILSPQFDGLSITLLLLSLTACQSPRFSSVWRPVNHCACAQFDSLSINLHVFSLMACQSPCVSSVWQPVNHLACPQFNSLSINLRVLSLTACQSPCFSVWRPVNHCACAQFDSLSINLRVLSLTACQSTCVSSVWQPVNHLAYPQFDDLSIALRVLSLMACQSPCVSSVWWPVNHLACPQFEGRKTVMLSYDDFIGLIPLLKLENRPNGVYDPKQGLQYRKLVVTASMTEGVSGVNLDADEVSIPITLARLKLEFLAATPSNFKPGLVYSGFVSPTVPYGPIQALQVHIGCMLAWCVVRTYWWSSWH